MRDHAAPPERPSVLGPCFSVRHWYGAVHRSTGAEGPLPELGGRYAKLAAEAMPFYERLAEMKL